MNFDSDGTFTEDDKGNWHNVGPVNHALHSDAGCWIDGHWGRYAITNLLTIAETEGWPGMDAELASAIRCNDAEFCSDSCFCQEIIVSAADEAEAWMNANLAPAGYSFGWHDGEFFLWSDESWAE